MPCVKIDRIFFCGPGMTHDLVCGVNGCRHASEFLCDWPMGKGKTCDIALCPEHAVKIGPDYHLCPVHAAKFKKAAASKNVFLGLHAVKKEGGR